MDIANQFQQIGIFLTQNRFIAVLKKIAMSAVPAVVSNGIPS
jgi:hypothetical protein